jgi:hypothetical protein
MALGAGICSAIAMFSIVFGSVLALPLFYLAPLPLYLAGLGIGGQGAVIAAVAAIAASGLIGGAYAALPFAIAYGLPAVTVCRQALRASPGNNGQPVWQPIGNVIGSLTVFGMATIVIAAFMTINDETLGPLDEAVMAFLSQALENMQGNIPVEARNALVSGLAPFFPGMAIGSWIVMHIVNAAAAQGALVKSGRNLRPAVSFVNVTLPDFCSWLLVCSGALAVFAPGDWGYIGQNLVIVALVPFFLLGLAVAHTFARSMAGGTWMLIFFYLLIVVLGWASFVVAGAGVLEQWVGLRKRARTTNNQETE